MLHYYKFWVALYQLSAIFIIYLGTDLRGIMLLLYFSQVNKNSSGTEQVNDVIFSSIFY